MERIYLDNNASTPLDPRVAEEMERLLRNPYGNPSSIHLEGREARALLDSTRRSISDFLRVHPHEIIFTSGATEAINLTLKGMFRGKAGGHVISSNLEHSATLKTLTYLESCGVQVTW